MYTETRKTIYLTCLYNLNAELNFYLSFKAAITITLAVVTLQQNYHHVYVAYHQVCVIRTLLLGS